MPDVLVELFDNNGITGQAEQAAAVLQGAGWNVSRPTTGTATSRPTRSTTHPALHDAAVKLAKVLHIERLHTAVAPIKFDRLTVIMVSSYALPG